jgi:YidC/Oxa1 family membrane protein insertase
MFSFLASLFGYLLNAIYGVVNNYGVAIIIFTVILKTVMLPISIKQQKTMKKSAKIQVKAKEIQEKYSNDQVRQSQELMDLYKKENMSPFGGCLSSIVQFIIILSVFYLVSSPLTYMKHLDSNLVNEYVQKVQEQSDSQIRYREIAIIKAFSDTDENVRLNMNFLGLDLSDVPSQNYTDWKVFVIPVLYVITSIISTKITTSMNNKKKQQEDAKKEKSKDENDEMAAIEDMNKQMMLMMPIMSVSIALIAPLGLALYWLVSNILMICERLILNVFFKEKEEE